MVIARSSIARGTTDIAVRVLHDGALQPNPPHPGGANGKRWQIAALTEAGATGSVHEDDCVISPPPPREVLASLGRAPEGEPVLLLVCCSDHNHIDAYCIPDNGTPQHDNYTILWDLATASRDGSYSGFLGEFSIDEIEHALEEPLFSAPHLRL